MQLAPQQFSNILTSLRPATPSGRGSEQRRHSRIRVRSKVVVAAIADDKTVRSYSALTSDISFGGIALMQSAAAANGSHLLVLLPRSDKHPLALMCVVSRCALLADGLYSVGVQFVQEASSGPEQPLLGAMGPGEHA